MKELFARIDSIVVGPGAGRNPSMLKTLEGVVSYALEAKKPLVVDGDGLWALTQSPDLFSNVKFDEQWVILTPNQMEFTRLWNRVMGESCGPSSLADSDEYVKRLANAYVWIVAIKQSRWCHHSSERTDRSSLQWTGLLY